MFNFKLDEKDLEKVNGGAGMVGLVTPMGEYTAAELIDLYLNNQAKAKQLIALAKLIRPDLIEDFKKECEEQNLTIPEGMLD